MQVYNKWWRHFFCFFSFNAFNLHLILLHILIALVSPIIMWQFLILTFLIFWILSFKPSQIVFIMFPKPHLFHFILSVFYFKHKNTPTSLQTNLYQSLLWIFLTFVAPKILLLAQRFQFRINKFNLKFTFLYFWLFKWQNLWFRCQVEIFLAFFLPVLLAVSPSALFLIPDDTQASFFYNNFSFSHSTHLVYFEVNLSKGISSNIITKHKAIAKFLQLIHSNHWINPTSLYLFSLYNWVHIIIKLWLTQTQILLLQISLYQFVLKFLSLTINSSPPPLFMVIASDDQFSKTALNLAFL
jgi:hypothetical protein